jgi:curli biogenesis system outer membrane secretion channel CsgG
MYKALLLAVTSLLLFLLSGCAQKVDVRALEPAEIDRIAYTRKITVTNFQNDKVGLSNKIEANLASLLIDNKNYFTIISRNDFDKIIKEQEIQNSGLVEEGAALSVGELIGAEAIISGNVSSPTSQDTHFVETRSKCGDKKCSYFVYYKVNCKNRAVGLSAEVRIVDIEKGDVIFADRLTRDAIYKHCSDYSSALPSTEMAAQKLSASMADEFTHRLSPHYKTFSVTLLEEPDLDYNDEQEKLLEVSLEYIEQGRYDKAEGYLGELIDTTESQSYVAFYNLGVIKEAQGKYAEAKEYYENADKLMVEPIDAINAAVVRIDSLIEKQAKLKKQMGESE